MQFQNLGTSELWHLASALQVEYADLIDDDQLEKLPDLFVEEGLYKLIPRENADRDLDLAVILCTSRAMLVDRIVSLREANIYPDHHSRHILSTTRFCAIERDFVRTQTSYAVLQTRNDGRTQIHNAGRYIDEIVSDDGRLKFRSKIAIFDTNRIDTLIALPV